MYIIHTYVYPVYISIYIYIHILPFMLRTPSFRSHIFHLLCFEIPSTKRSLPTCAYIYTYIHVYSYIIWKCIQYIRITYNADLSLKLIHRDSLIMSHHGRGRLDLKSLRLPKFHKVFTGVPVHIKHAFAGGWSPHIFKQVVTWVPITQKSVRENRKNLEIQISKYSSVISSVSIHVDLSLKVSHRDAFTMRHSSGHSHLEWLVYQHNRMHLQLTWLCIECRCLRDTFSILCPASSFIVTRLHFYWPVPTHLSCFLRLIHESSYVILVATTGAGLPSIPHASCVTCHIVGYMSMCDSSFVWL